MPYMIRGYSDSIGEIVCPIPFDTEAKAQEALEILRQISNPRLMNSIIKAGPTEVPAIRRSCNRHDDCAEAEARFKKDKGRDPGPNFHCHDDECEDCFGC